jgi:4-amino-4-deoxy-L-arabinose transferase-like glycosyltransferase
MIKKWTTAVGEFWQKHPKNRWLLSILWVLLLGWIAFLWNLGNTGLIDETEPLFAEAARQMAVTGDWITPYFNGETRFDKPPLVYWLMAIGYKIIGTNSLAVRLPSAISAIALVAMAFYTLRYFATDNSKFTTRNSNLPWIAAGIGAGIIALNPITIVWGRIGVSDMLLTGCIVSALLCFFIGYAKMGHPENVLTQNSKFSPWYLAFYLLIALAILAKGPVGIVLPGLIIAAFLLYLGNFNQVCREIRLLRGLLLVGAIAIPWYVLVIWRNGEAYIDSFFGYHNLQRFTSVVNRHGAPWYFYFLVVLVGFAPWSSYLPNAIANTRFWQRKYWQKSPRSAQLGLFAFFWFAVIFIFFTIAVTKLPHYVLPAMPAAGILISLLFTDEFEREENQNQKTKLRTQNSKLFWSGLFNLVLAIILAIALFISPMFVGYDPAAPNLQQLFQQSGIPIAGAIVWGLTAVGIALFLRDCQRRKWLWTINLIGFAAFIIFAITPGYFLVDRTRQLPLREIAAIAVKQQRPGEEFVMIGFDKPTLVFYTQRPVTFFPNFEEAFIHIEQTAVKQPPSVLILAQINKIRPKFLQNRSRENIVSAGGYQLMRVSKTVKN